MDSELFTVFLPLTLTLMMMGLGLHLRPVDFYRLAQYPKVIFIALFSQLVLLVGIAFLICNFLNLSPIFSIGLMLVAASPGGPTSTIMTYLFKGDIALNITLTAANSVIATFTLPFILNLSMIYFLQTAQPIDIPATKIAKVFFLTLVPVSTGMCLRYFLPKFAIRLHHPMRILSLSCLFFIFFIALYLERHNLIQYIFEVGPAIALFCFSSMFIGFFIPHIANITEKQALTCSFEITIHNTALAITVALSVLGNTAMAIPAGIYSIFMFVFATLFGLLVSQKKDRLFFKRQNLID